MNRNSLQSQTDLQEFGICDLSTDFFLLFATPGIGTGIFRYVEACVQLRNHRFGESTHNILQLVTHDRGEYLCRISLDHSMDPWIDLRNF